MLFLCLELRVQKSSALFCHLMTMKKEEQALLGLQFLIPGTNAYKKAAQKTPKKTPNKPKTVTRSVKKRSP